MQSFIPLFLPTFRRLSYFIFIFIFFIVVQISFFICIGFCVIPMIINNTLYFSHHVNMLTDGVDHLIELLTRTISCLSRSHSTFACRSFQLPSPLPPFSSSRSRLVVESIALVVFTLRLVVEASHGREKRRNPRPLEWQASVLTTRPCHSLLCVQKFGFRMVRSTRNPNHGYPRPFYI